MKLSVEELFFSLKYTSIIKKQKDNETKFFEIIGNTQPTLAY